MRCAVQAQCAGGSPIALVILGRAGEACHGARRGEDAHLQIAQLRHELIRPLVEVVDQIFQEQVEVDAAQLLVHHARRRDIGDGAGERCLVACGDEHLLHTDLHLREHIAHAIGVLEHGLAPHLARDVCERLDLLGECAGGHAEHGSRESPVLILVENLGGKGEEAEVRAYVAVELGGAMALGCQLLHQAAENLCVRKLGVAQVAQVKVGERVGEPMGGNVVDEAGDGRRGIDGERILGARRSNVRDAQSGQRRLRLG